MVLWVRLAGADVTLAWDPEPAAVIFTLYWGTNSGTYTHSNSCPGIETNLTATGLLANQVYYFAATASAVDGTRSGFSKEISFTNAPGAISKPTPGIIRQPSSASVAAGGIAQFTVIATGAQSYQWYKSGAAIVDGAGFKGGRTATLTVHPAAAADVAPYNVVVANASGSSTSAVVVLTTVVALTANGVPVPASPAVPLPTLAANLGQSASIGVAVNGDAPVLYQWQLNGHNIFGATSQQLLLLPVTDTNAGTYSVVVSSGGKSMTNKVREILNVINPPVIVNEPASQTMKVGAEAVFRVVETGSAPKYQWYKDGAALRNGGHIFNAAAAALVVSPISEADAGSYVVVLANSAGVATSAPAVLAVVAAPVQILSQPRSVAVLLGETAVWGVGAIGTPPLTYQWSFDGNLIPDATRSRYYINSVVPSEEGAYTVIISNPAGTIESHPATLTVINR